LSVCARELLAVILIESTVLPIVNPNVSNSLRASIVSGIWNIFYPKIVLIIFVIENQNRPEIAVLSNFIKQPRMLNSELSQGICGVCQRVCDRQCGECMEYFCGVHIKEHTSAHRKNK
jgi:hypothetical protein